MELKNCCIKRSRNRFSQSVLRVCGRGNKLQFAPPNCPFYLCPKVRISNSESCLLAFLHTEEENNHSTERLSFLHKAVRTFSLLHATDMSVVQLLVLTTPMCYHNVQGSILFLLNHIGSEHDPMQVCWSLRKKSTYTFF